MQKELLYNMSYGVYALGFKDQNNRNCGCIVNTAFQISSEGPTIAISMNKNNYSHKLMKENKKFTLSILSENTNPEVISRLGFISSEIKDKWQNFKFDYVENMPIVKDNIVGYMICEVLEMYDANTHDIVLCKVVDAKIENDLVPMTYKYYHDVLKGNEPKNAPLYRGNSKEEIKNDDKQKEKYVCGLCNWEYDGEDFENLADDYVCPLCGAPKNLFEKR